MSLSIYYKMAATVIIFVITLLGGLFPIYLPVNQRTKLILAYGGAFAGGVFLGVGLIHLLPDAENTFRSIYPNHYPFMFLLCALTILFLRLLEDGSLKLFQRYHNAKETLITFLLTILLSVHSLIEGAALGIESTLAGLLIIFIAIFAHKSAESFSLGISMRQSALSVRTMKKLLLLFSFMTPVGITFGSILSHAMAGRSGLLTEAIFNAVAAGTFIYIATSHSIACSCHCHDEHDGTSILWQTVSFIAGLLLMAGVAIWL